MHGILVYRSGIRAVSREKKESKSELFNLSPSAFSLP